MSSQLKVAVNGALGRMGQQLVKEVSEHAATELVAAFERADCQVLGADIGLLSGLSEVGVALTALPSPGAETTHSQPAVFDVLIDFSRPVVTLANVDYCRQQQKTLVIGTTGFSPEELKQIETAAADIPIFLAPNMSVGVNLLFELVKIAAQAMGDTPDIEIVETHHRHKVDAPSGTALRIGEVIANALDRQLENDAVFGRHGITGPRERRQIGFSALRGGDVVGDHTAYFIDEGERIEITHRASNRNIYAKGAVRAALWLRDQPPGLYDMPDILFENSVLPQ